MSMAKPIFDFNQIGIDIKKDNDGRLYFNIDDMIGILQFEVIDNDVDISAVSLAKSLIEVLIFAKVWTTSSEEDEKSKAD